MHSISSSPFGGKTLLPVSRWRLWVCEIILQLWEGKKGQKGGKKRVERESRLLMAVTLVPQGALSPEGCLGGDCQKHGNRVLLTPLVYYC